MKKYVIIIFVLTALVFGSCGELQKGGTIKVENESSDYDVKIYITKSLLTATPPTSAETVATGIIKAKKTGQISIKENGMYYIKPFFIVPGLGETIGMVDPITDATAILSTGNTVSVKVKMIVE